MTLHIADPEADRLARELAELTGEPIDQAVINALREKLAEKERKAEEVKRMVEGALAISRHYRSLPVLDSRSADEIIGYDENGLPT